MLASMLSVSQPRRSRILWQIICVIRLLDCRVLDVSSKHSCLHTNRRNVLSALKILWLCDVEIYYLLTYLLFKSWYGWGTMTTESCKNGATTLPHINFSGYVGHVTMFSWMLTTACSLVVGSGLWLDLVSGRFVVMHTYLYYSPLLLFRTQLVWSSILWSMLILWLNVDCIVLLGDLGYYDTDGHLVIEDRIKEMIKVKGHQVNFRIFSLFHDN